MSKSKKMICEENETMLARANSQIGSLKRYNSRKLILQYSELLSDKVLEHMAFDYTENNFIDRRRSKNDGGM